MTLLLCVTMTTTAQYRNLKTFNVIEAHQGVAVDKEYFYVINNTSITKHMRSTGQQIAKWNGTETGLKHLNAGIVENGLLYCAHSNYPDLPMVSSIEVFDTKNMHHVASHSFGIEYGSLTWIDHHNGYFWAVFANYNKDGYPHPNTWTQLIKFDSSWRRLQAWVFPKDLVDKFGRQSCSGGFFIADSTLYVSGHDLPEMYVLNLPQYGSILKLVKAINVPFRGQSISVDKSVWPYIFWGINREKNQVLQFELEENK